MAFEQVRIIPPDIWVGLKHFQTLFASPVFYQVLANTLIISAMKIAFVFPVPIVVALLLNEVRGGALRKFMQSAIYLPHFLSWVVIAGIFIALLSPSDGAVNQIIGWFGMRPVSFMTENGTIRWVLVFSEIWRSAGWDSLLYLAAIIAIDPQLYDAAEMDGANRWQKIRDITIPGIVPTIATIFILNMGMFLSADLNQVINLINDVNRSQIDILDTWDMADGMVRQIAWTPRWVPELRREAMLIERLFYPEKWIFQRHQLAGCDPRQGGVGNMVNCGAAMYIAPIGVVNACDPRAAYDEAIALASGHQQSFGLEAAGVLAAAVAAAFVPGTSIDAVVEEVLKLAKDGTRGAIADIAEAARALRTSGAPHAEVVERFHAIIARYSPIGDDFNYAPQKAGVATDAYQPSRLHSIEELPVALGFCLVNDGAFRKSIEDGINSGRDTDSIGVMTGAILGALHGEAVIDPADAATLDAANRFDLGHAADLFADTALAVLNADRLRRTATEHARNALLGAVADSLFSV